MELRFGTKSADNAFSSILCRSPNVQTWLWQKLGQFNDTELVYILHVDLDNYQNKESNPDFIWSIWACEEEQKDVNFGDQDHEHVMTGGLINRGGFEYSSHT